jgi:hypothetical protein
MRPEELGKGLAVANGGVAERQSCSPAVSRLRPNQGAGKSSRVPVSWCGAVALEQEARGRAEGQAPRSSALREQRPNSGEPLRRRESLARRADASSDCRRAKRCSWRGVVADGELERTELPAPASGSACGGVRCAREEARRKEGKKKGEALRGML